MLSLGVLRFLCLDLMSLLLKLKKTKTNMAFQQQLMVSNHSEKSSCWEIIRKDRWLLKLHFVFVESSVAKAAVGGSTTTWVDVLHNGQKENENLTLDDVIEILTDHCNSIGNKMSKLCKKLVDYVSTPNL